MRRILYLTIVGLLTSALSALADPTLTLEPADGVVTGSPGDTVGWGFSITNDDPDNYLVVSFSDFCETGDPVTGPCFQSLGSYEDIIAGNGTVLANSTGGIPTELDESFDSTNFTGLGEYLISDSAAPGAVDQGYIEVVYDLYSDNPYTDPNAVEVQGDTFLTVPAEVMVAGGVAAVPEPRFALLLAFGFAILIFWGNRKRNPAHH